MRHDQCDVVNGHAGAAHDVEAGLAHALHRLAKDFLAVEIPSSLSELHAQIGVHGAHAAHAQDLPRVCVTLQLLGDDTGFLLRRLQHHGCRAVAEQHGHISVVPVHVLGNQFHTYHQRILDDAALDHR